MKYFASRRFALALLAASFAQPLFAREPIPDMRFIQEYRDAFIRDDAATVTVAPTRRRRQPAAKENDIRAIAVDKQQRVWAGTSAGLRQVVDGKLVDPLGERIDGSVYKLAVADDGVVWVGAWDGVYRIVDGKVEKEAGEGVPAGPITALVASGKIIFAANDKGIDLRGEDGKWQHVPGPWSTTILDLAVTDDSLYIAAWSGLYRKTADNVEYLTGPEHLLSRNLRALAVGKDGRLYVGSRGGVDVYYKGKRERTLTGKDGLPSTDVLSLNVGNMGRIWVGTSMGVARFDGKNWSLRHSLRWLPDDEVRDVAFSPDRTAWVATGNGVVAIREKEMTLAEKAKYFEDMVRARHVRPPGLTEHVRLPEPGNLARYEATDTDNDGLFTGLYLAAESYRYAVTKEADAKANADEAYGAMEYLQTVTDTPGFIARTVIPSEWRTMADGNRTYTPQEIADNRADEARWKKVEQRWRKSGDGKWLWKGDTSSDEMSGHYFAYGVYFDHAADGPHKERVANLVKKVTDYIIDGGYVFRDIDGDATRWGVWSPEKLNDDPNWWLERGVNSVEILSYLTVARHVTGDQKYEQEIEKLLNKHGYAQNILTPMQPGADYYTYIGHQLLALSYRALLLYEKNPDRAALYRKSLANWFEPIRKDGSPLYAFVYAMGMEDDYGAQACADLLRDVPLDQIEWDVDNSRREDVKFVGVPVEGSLQTDRLLPASERGVFRWDRNVYDARRGSGGRAEGTSVFWLLPYWMGRYHGLIAAPKT